MIDEYVDGRPMPSSSIALTSDASVYRAGGWVVCPIASSASALQRLVLGQRRQPALGVLGLGVFVVGRLDVGPQEAGVGDGLAARAEVAFLARRRHRPDPDRHRRADRVGHLRCDGAAPDQLVELELLGGQLVRDLAGRPERVAGRADRLVRLLRVLHLAGVPARLRRHARVAVQFADLRTGGGDRRLGQVHRVGTHIGDVSVFVQALGGSHRLRGREPHLPSGLLLQRGRDERRVRPAPVRLLLDPRDRERLPVQSGREASGAACSSRWTTAPRTLPVVGSKSLPDAIRSPSSAIKRGRERTRTLVLRRQRGERRGDVPVVGGAERHPLLLALDHDPRRHRLHPTGGQPRHDLLPQHRARPRTRTTGPGCAAPLARRPAHGRSRGGSRSAAWMAGLVISWKTIRLTGTLGLIVSSRCQAIASPSRSSSVAR